MVLKIELGMYRLNPDCRLRSPRPPLCLLPQHPRNHASATLSHREEEEEEEEEHPAVCCYTTGCDDIISQAADAQWSTSEPPIHSGIPSSSGLSGQGPGALSSSQQPKTVTGAGGGDVSRHLPGGCCLEDLGMETQGCVCVYGQREPDGLGPCWPGSPYVYYGVRRNLVVGVEVVEEVAVEDTLEVITEDIYTDIPLDSALLHDAQMYPT